jgi:signal transduction histidine kinase
VVSSGTAGLADEVEILRRLCHGFASTSELGQALRSSVEWVKAVVGEGCSVRILLPDRSDRLHSAISFGGPTTEGRRRSARRRVAYERRRVLRYELRQPVGHLLALFPLVSRGEAVGVLEVSAHADVIQERWPALDAVVSQTAIVIRNLRQVATLRRRLHALEIGANALGTLSSAKDLGEAVRSVVDLCYELAQAPVAAWVADGSASNLRFYTARGMGTRKRAQVRSDLAWLPRVLNGAGPTRSVERFASIVGADDVSVMDSPNAIVLVADGSGRTSEFPPVLTSLIRDALDRVADPGLATSQSEQLELGLAWTAHEVRTPLLGARATIDYVLQDAPHGTGRELLSRSKEELGELAAMVEAVLRWGAGQGTLDLRPVDLVEIVRASVDASAHEGSLRRVRLVAPRRVRTLVDPSQLKAAVTNVLRNALLYSPSDAEVDVRVEHDRAGMATVIVRDRGPGILPSERDSVFEPLVRGTAGRRSPYGAGLGLFIAKRVVEAHGGTISLESDPGGTIFRVELPVEEEEEDS